MTAQAPTPDKADPAPARALGEPPALSISGAIATLTLRRPQVANRLELTDLPLLLEHLATVNANPAVRVLMLNSQGRHFCSGFNLGDFGQAVSEGSARFEAVANALESARPITVAAIRGGAYGGAVDLALACDFRIGTPACDMFVPAAKLGLHFYRSGMERMVTRLGLAGAKRLLLAVETLQAPALLQIGMLDRVVAAEALDAEAQGFCEHLAGLAPLALLPMKQHLNAMARKALDADALQSDIQLSLASADLQEGALAWAQQRTPRFSGC